MAEIIALRAFPDHRLWLRYSDGVQGIVRLDSLLDIGAFTLLRDPAAFLDARVDRYGGVSWPVGARLDQHVLYSETAIEGSCAQPPSADQRFQRFMRTVLHTPKKKRRRAKK